MKVSIIIKGQNNSVNKLIRSFSKVAKEKYFYHEIKCDTKAEATTLLADAANYLKEDREDWRNGNGAYYRGDLLSYDAATARIYNPNK